MKMRNIRKAIKIKTEKYKGEFVSCARIELAWMQSLDRDHNTAFYPSDDAMRNALLFAIYEEPIRIARQLQRALPGSPENAEAFRIVSLLISTMKNGYRCLHCKDDLVRMAGNRLVACDCRLTINKGEEIPPDIKDLW